MSLELEIPEELYEAKPFYRTRGQAEAVVSEIKQHIRSTGLPHTWRHHTHSKPVTGARVTYLGQFDLPLSHQAPDRHAPCPCCSPRHPKFSRNGKIAWFPDEHVIRMIGPDCFATLNPDGHWEAVAQFDREEAERKTIIYLNRNLHLSSSAIDTIKKALPTLQAIDVAHATLMQRLTEVMRLDMWKHVERGVLNVHVVGRRLRRRRDGSEEVEEFTDIQPLSQFPGYQMFNPRTSKLASRMQGAATRLSFVNFGEETAERVAAMDQEERVRAARVLSSGLTQAKTIFDEAGAIRQGFSPHGISILKGWLQHSGCPVHVHVSGDHSSYYIGTDEFQKMRIELPGTFWTAFGELPKIATIAQWSEEQE